MKLWLLSQQEVNDYDTYDSCVVCAATEEEAREMRPDSCNGFSLDWTKDNWPDWATQKESVKVEYLGTAARGSKRRMICASFNAG